MPSRLNKASETDLTHESQVMCTANRVYDFRLDVLSASHIEYIEFQLDMMEGLKQSKPQVLSGDMFGR